MSDIIIDAKEVISNLKNIGLNTLTKINGIKISKASVILASIELGKRVLKQKELEKLTQLK